MRNIADKIPGGRIRTIAFTSGVCEVPIEVEVVRFKPMKGDTTKRYWTTVHGERLVYRSKALAPYCLADIHKTAAAFDEYINVNWEKAFLFHANTVSAKYDREPAIDDDGDTPMDDVSQPDTFNSESLKSDEIIPDTDIITKAHRVAYLYYHDLPVGLHQARFNTDANKLRRAKFKRKITRTWYPTRKR